MTASRAFVATFNQNALVPDRDFQWDDYLGRLFRYALWMSFYNNFEYNWKLMAFANAYKQRSDLYKHIRSIYNPVARQNDIYVAKTYGGSLDMQKLERGAIPIAQADDTLRDALRQVWIDSNMGTMKSLYVRLGCMLGDSFLWVVDDRVRGKVRLEVLDARKVKETVTDDAGNIIAATIEYLKTDPETQRDFTFTMVVDRERYATFKDGNLHPFFADFDGELIAEWTNDYGFVPMVHVKHKDVGQQYGAPPFHNSVGKIDELNDAASLLNDSVRKAVNIVWFMPGARAADIAVSGELDDGTSTQDPTARRDRIPMLFAGDKSQTPFAMVSDINIADALMNIKAMIDELERDMPELALHKLRDSSNITAPGVRAGYSDATDRITEARGNYDHALVMGQQMTISIGAFRRYEGYEAYQLESWERGDLQHTVAERPVIDDSISQGERIQALASLPEQPAKARLVLEALDYSEDRIEAIIAELETQQQANTSAAVRGFAESLFASDDDDDDEMTEDVIGQNGNVTEDEPTPAGEPTNAG